MNVIKKSKALKMVAVFAGIAMALSLVAGAGVANVQAALTQSQVDSIISLLQSFGADAATIQNVRVSLEGGTPTTGGGGTTGGGTGYVFSTDLQQGDTGEDVRQLQIALNNDGVTVAATGVGSPGNETSYFGSLTKSAVIRFQNKYASEILTPVGLSNGTGYVGPSTRAKLNSMGTVVVTPPPTTGGGGTTTPPPAVGTGLTVSKPTQPENSLAPQGAARVPFTKVTLTAGSDGAVTVNSLTVERVGLAQDSAFASIVLLDDQGLQVGLSKTFNSNHRATVGEAVTIPAGQSRTFTVAGNMAASLANNAGEVPALSVVSVNTSAAVSGVLPIVGAAHTTNATISIGTVTAQRGPLDPNAAVTKNVGTTGYIFSSVKITAGSAEKVRLHSIRWNQASSASDSDLKNVKTVVDGVEYPTTLSADGKFYTTTFGSGIVIDKGLSKEMSVKADIDSGSGRTIAFNVEEATDIHLTGELYGYGISLPTSGTGISSGNIWYAGKTVTIAAGSMTVENATSVVSQNIAINQNDQTLGGFNVDIKGEPISVAQMVFNLATTGSPTTGGSSQLITNISIVDENGVVVAGPADATGSTAAQQQVTFTDTIEFPVGKRTYTLKGKLGSNFANNGTVIVSTTPTSNWTTIKGVSTGKTVTPSSATVSMNTMTAKSGALTISVSPSPAAQTIVAGTQDFTFANYQLDATASGEDLQMSSFILESAVNSGATNITNCRIFNGATALTTGTNAKDSVTNSSTTTFTFDVPLTVPKGTVTTLALKCNVASGATGVYQFGYDSSASPTATGLISGQSVSIVENDSAGQRMTLASAGTLSVTEDSSSPSYKIVSAGTTDNTLNVLRFEGTNEDIRLQEIALVLTNTSSSSPSDISKVTLWDGATKVGEAIFTGTNTVATSTITGTVIVPKNDSKLITIKADLAGHGQGLVGQPGAFIAIDWDSSATIGTTGIGQGSGQTIEAGGSGSDTSSAGIRVFKSVPTIELVSLPTSKLTAGRQPIFRFKVTASPQGSVGIYQITFRMSTTSATSQSGMITDVNAYAFTDSGYSNPVSGLSTTDGRLAASHSNTWAAATTDIEITANDGSNNTTVIVPAGQTRYFEIQGTATLAGTQYSLATQLQGDAKFVSDRASSAHPAGTSGTAAGSPATFLATSTYIAAAGDDDFIWRPFSTTTSQSANANDYTNGYGIIGLPTGNTNTQVLTQ